jgi:N-dimethylarginine dimethylaminohydrolase
VAVSGARSFSAYQGRGWRPRPGRLADDVARGRGLWAPLRVDSEYKRLEAVLLHRPGPELARVRRPNDVQHLERIEPAAIGREFAALAAVFRRRGVAVRAVPRLRGGPWPEKPNLMYARDLFFATPEGAVVARMASAVRAGEEKHAALALAELGVPVNRTIAGAGTFEGADALWLDARTVVCAVGARTNAEGFRQLGEALRAQGVAAVPVKLPSGVQHLLGLLQIVDARLALLRTERAPRELTRLLKRRGFRIVPVPETEETVVRQGMNVVTVAPRAVLMPDDCPDLERLYKSAGLTIAAKLDVRQLRRGAGGLACAVGILSRRA